MRELVEGDRVRLTRDVPSDFRDEVFPAGARGEVLEVYREPSGCLVELTVPDPTLVGDLRFETVAVPFEALESDPESLWPT